MKELEIEKLLLDRGASLVGFCQIDQSPIQNQPDLKYAVTIVYKLSDAVLKTIEDRPSMAYFQHYRAVNSRIQGTRFKVFSSDYMFPAIDNLALHLYDKAPSTSYESAANKLYNDSLDAVKDLWDDYK